MDIVDAAEKGDYNEVKRLLTAGRDPNSKDESWGFTALHSAAGIGRRDIAELLLAKGANVNAMDTTGATPLHEAAKRGHLDCAELLLTHGAEINRRTSQDDMTPLQMTLELHPNRAMEDLLRKHGGIPSVRAPATAGDRVPSVVRLEQFCYVGMDTRGKEVGGCIEAASRDEVIGELKRREIFPTKVNPLGSVPPEVRIVQERDRALEVEFPCRACTIVWLVQFEARNLPTRMVCPKCHYESVVSIGDGRPLAKIAYLQPLGDERLPQRTAQVLKKAHGLSRGAKVAVALVLLLAVVFVAWWVTTH